MVQRQLVLVTWLDAQDHKDKWVDEHDAEAFTDEECKITSVGFLVRKTEKYVTIAGDWDAVDTDYGRVTKIPTKMVVDIKGLNEGDNL